jgi:trehalose 6-phosphate phosphatase
MNIPDAPIDAPLDAALRRAAAWPVLLVASDFDGTLAPIVSDPAAATAHAEGLAVLQALSRMPDTHVAVVSGRSLDDLRPRVHDAGAITLIGGHGAEVAGEKTSLPAELAQRRAWIETLVQDVAARTPGAIVETKPLSVAFHFRNVPPERAPAAVAELLRAAASKPVQVNHGKMVVELGVIKASKGAAIARLRQRLAASGLLFVGDDVTDETVFATMGRDDVPIKVGAGETAARYRVADTRAVVALLERLATLRAAHLRRPPA